MADLMPCGTYAAYKRHVRAGEPVDDLCAQAARDEKNARSDRARQESGSSLADALDLQPEVDEVDALVEAKDSLRIVRAALRSSPPHNTIPALTKRRDELVDRIKALEADGGEVSVFDRIDDELADRRVRKAGA